MDDWELSDEEWEVFQDRQFMPLKQLVWQKMEAILRLLAKDLSVSSQNPSGSLPFDWTSSAYKISRGENYHTYAYRVLDYPRVNTGQEFFLFRTMLLWGHPIGIHLILSEQYRDTLPENLPERLKALPDYWRISAQNKPWVWEPDFGNLPLLKALSDQEIQEILSKRKFLKISRFLPLADYLKIPQTGLESWSSLQSLWK